MQKNKSSKHKPLPCEGTVDVIKQPFRLSVYLVLLLSDIIIENNVDIVQKTNICQTTIITSYRRLATGIATKTSCCNKSKQGACKMKELFHIKLTPLGKYKLHSVMFGYKNIFTSLRPSYCIFMAITLFYRQ